MKNSFIILSFLYTLCLAVGGNAIYGQDQMSNFGNMQTFSGSKLGIFGSFLNDSTFENNKGQFYLAGYDSTTLSGKYKFQVDSLIVTKTDDTFLEQEFIISTHANFINGVLYTDISKDTINHFHFLDNATYTGASDTSHVNGVVRKTGNDAFSYPIGDSLNLQPLAQSAPTLVTESYFAYYRQVDPDGLYSRSLKEAGIDHLSACEYWVFDSLIGSSALAIQLDYDLNSCGITAQCNLLMARWDTTQWVSHGNGGVTGTISAGTIRNGSGCATPAFLPYFGPFTLASDVSSANPLPVELIDFKATAKDEDIELNWSTATEINNDYFTIDYSTDGKNWQYLLDHKSVGNSQSKQNYTDKHLNPGPGMHYYLLKQTDLNGTKKQLLISMDKLTGKPAVYAYLTGNGTTLNIHFGAGIQPDSWRLVNTLGQEVRSESMFLETGQEEFVVELGFLASGMYFLHLGETIIKFRKD